MNLLGRDSVNVVAFEFDRGVWRTKVWSGVKTIQEAGITHVWLKRDLMGNVMTEMNQNAVFAGTKIPFANAWKANLHQIFCLYVCVYLSMQCKQ